MKRIYIYSTLCFLLTYMKVDAQQIEQGTGEKDVVKVETATNGDKQDAKRSLAECIQLAIKANPTLLQNELAVRRAEVNLSQAKSNRLPDLNGRLGHSLTSGRSVDNATNQYITRNNSSGNFGLDASVPVFNGFRILNDIRMRADAKTAGKLEFDSQVNALKLDVITAYIQVLTAQDVLKQSEMQTEVTREQVRRAESMQKEGAINPGDYFDLKGQLANDINMIESNKQRLYTNRVKLAGFLNVDEAQLGDLQALELKTDAQKLDATALYKLATESLPDIPALEWRIKAAEKNIKIAQSSYWPSLSLNGGLSSNYSKNVTTGGYWYQMKNNLGKAVSLNLSIPVFNRFKVRNDVKLAKLDLESSKFQREIALNNLRAETANAVFNLKNASNTITQLHEQNTNYAESFRIAKVVFELGNSNSVIFLTAKTKYDNSQIQLVVKQYEWLLQKYINDYYAGSLNL
ncbi:TolC family protein [Sphingobacterium sp. BIGb0165]|uniref:TolC family protein n=1 Tax=Sphingobacterium sp. BIGb0165 TaxID=2940615 RepID=UPI002166C7CB|nr:TolC family protein [Sphingobacterium sp. BIGb0165]MCS4228317.1 outer membrane protein [Sphingobacterium sp. BIGb0165]